MSRITMLSREDAIRRGTELGIDEYIAQLNLFRVLLNYPELALELNKTIIQLVTSDAHLSHRLRELIIMRVAWLTRSEYEWTQHYQVSLIFGLTTDEIVAIRDWQNADCFNGTEELILKATDETIENGKISDETWAGLAHVFSNPASLVTIVTSIGNWQMFSQILRSLEIPLEDEEPIWPPDGVGPQ